jgi:hypothetical protein
MFHIGLTSMLVLRCSSSAGSVHELVGLAGSMGGGMLLLRPQAARTMKELEFCLFLAGEAFREKTGISGKLANEAMLFLACETNFSSAARKVGAASADDFVLVSQKKIQLAKLKGKLLLTKAEKLPLPEWGRKKGHYFEGELAVERMALARIKN